MLEYDRTDISEGTDIKKTNGWKECKVCHYCYFKNIVFKHELYLCNSFHGLMQKVFSFNDVVIVYVTGSAYRIHVWYISKDDAIP